MKDERTEELRDGEETEENEMNGTNRERHVKRVNDRLLLRSSYSLASVFFPFVPYVTHFSHPLISFESERSEGRNEGRMTDRAEGTTRGPVPGS